MGSYQACFSQATGALLASCSYLLVYCCYSTFFFLFLEGNNAGCVLKLQKNQGKLGTEEEICDPKITLLFSLFVLKQRGKQVIYRAPFCLIPRVRRAVDTRVLWCRCYRNS